MNLQDYQVLVRRLAEKFIQSRTHAGIEGRRELLDAARNNPSLLQFHGYMVSVFAAYYTPGHCASIIAASNSQDCDPSVWNTLRPREAIFAMAFELLKEDVWKETMFVLQGLPDAKNLESSDQQLTMFDAA
jgi:hypothetical protein